jgi:hypothetical protein
MERLGLEHPRADPDLLCSTGMDSDLEALSIEQWHYNRVLQLEARRRL